MNYNQAEAAVEGHPRTPIEILAAMLASGQDVQGNPLPMQSVSASPQKATTITDAGSTVSVTTTALLLFASNTNRTYNGAVFENNGSVTVYVGLTNAVTAASGRPVLPGGDWTSGYWTGALWAITASGTADIRRSEVSA